MSNKSNRPGTEFSDDEIALITSLGLLGVTSAGQHIAKTGTGTLANTPDSGGGGVSDGDYGDVNVTGSGTIWTVEGFQPIIEKNDVSGYPGLENTPNSALKLFQNGLGSTQAKYQVDRIHRRDIPPTVGDDDSQGYLEEDLWVVKNGISRGIWVCLETTVGAANWKKLNMPTWWDVVIGASAKGAPVAVTGGTVVEHTYEGISLYRFLPSPPDPSLDNFYLNFDGTDVTDLVIKRVP